MTLTVDLETQDHTHSLYDLSYLRLYTSYRLDLGVDSNNCKVEDLRKSKISHMTLMVDLENEGKTHLCMTFRISGCKHHTDMIFVSILTMSRTRMSKMLKQFTYLQRLTLKLKVIHILHMTLLISGIVLAIDSILVSILTLSKSEISENPFSIT